MPARLTYGKRGARRLEALELYKAGKGRREIAAAMGIAPTTANNLVRHARIAAGTYVPKRERPPNLRYLGEEFEHDDAEIDTTPGCARCGLRGEHECLPASATAYVGRRGEPDCTRYSETRRAGG